MTKGRGSITRKRDESHERNAGKTGRGEKEGKKEDRMRSHDRDNSKYLEQQTHKLTFDTAEKRKRRRRRSPGNGPSSEEQQETQSSPDKQSRKKTAIWRCLK